MGLTTDEDEEILQKPSNCFGARHVQTLLLFFAMLISFTMRVNMSIAIVAMNDPSNEKVFHCSLTEESIILSSFFWGYVVLQVPAGELARRVGGKNLVTIAVLVNSLVSLIIPFGAKFGGVPVVIGCRVCQGFTQGFLYPAMHHLISQWIPLQEKGRLGTFIYAGAQLGITIQLITSGFVASAWGWPAIFYTNGIIGVIWSAVYLYLGADSPETCKFIKDDELKYIHTSLGRKSAQRTHATPWLKIVKSLPFWAIVVAHCGQNWGFFTLMTEIPSYMSKVLHEDLKSNGVLSSLPYLAMYLLSFPMGWATDLIIRKKWLSVTNTRKLFNTIGLWGPAIALIGLSFCPSNNIPLAVVMLTATVGINAGQYTGYMLVHIDMAPNYSASLMGITNFLANIVSILAPLECGRLVKHVTDPAEWRLVFYEATGVYFFSNLFFILFATAEKQPWNEPDDVDKEIEMQPTKRKNTRDV